MFNALMLVAQLVALLLAVFAVASLFAAIGQLYSAFLPHNLGIDDYYDPEGNDWNNE